MAKIKPLDDRVVVQALEQQEKTLGGIFLPETAKEKPQQGKVIATGPGRVLDNGDRAPMNVKKGDVVLFAKYSGSEVEVDGKELLIMRESDLLAVVES
jgi:chaperonin GroES